MEVLDIYLDDLKPYENNPRIITEDAIEKVMNSIKEFGFKVPILIDESMTIIAGHTRLKAAKKLGLEKVPCIKVGDLTDEQIRAFRLADNKVAEFSKWDWDKLELELKDLELEEFGFVNVDSNYPEDIETEEDWMDIDDNGMGNATGNEYKLTCGDIKIILTKEEYELLEQKYKKYVSENGVSFGFILELCHD